MMERATLESFLAPISRQLGHDGVPDAIDVPDYRDDAPARRTDGLDHKQLVIMFGEEAEKIRVMVHRCKVADVADAVADIVSRDGDVGPVVYADDPRIDELGIPAALDACAAVSDAVRWDAAARRDAMVGACNDARFGITYALGGIAETGTIVQPCDAGCGRAISLLPLAHIALVDERSVKATMGDWLAVLDEQGGVDGAGLPSQVCFISGPSVTSDIELVRVEGVHGPMFVHYVIVE